jgi:hypothetical protein
LSIADLCSRAARSCWDEAAGVVDAVGPGHGSRRATLSSSRLRRLVVARCAAKLRRVDAWHHDQHFADGTTVSRAAVRPSTADSTSAPSPSTGDDREWRGEGRLRRARRRVRIGARQKVGPLNTARVPEGATVLKWSWRTVSRRQGARLAGAARIFASDPLPERRKAAETFGATDLLDPNAEDVAVRVREATGVGADFAFETAGRASLVRGTAARQRRHRVCWSAADWKTR